VKWAFEWLGFYNNIEEKRIIPVSDFDFEMDNKAVHLVLCKKIIEVKFIIKKSLYTAIFFVFEPLFFDFLYFCTYKT